jgi:GNAT superfamily N-acetyltransferase
MENESILQLRYLRDRPQHIDLLTGWLNREFDTAHDDEALARRRARLLAYAASERIPFTRVLLDGETPLGTGSLLSHDLFGYEEEFPFTPWVASLYVIPERRGKGYGTLLLNDLMEIARRLGFPGAYLWTEEKNVPYYARHGWTETGRVLYRNKTGIIMKAAL